jgi:hypothetical protein
MIDGRSQESTVDDPWQLWFLQLTAATLVWKNVPARCVEESVGNVSTAPSRYQQAVSTPPRRMSASVWPLWIQSQGGYTPDVKRKQINIVLVLDFDIRRFFGLKIRHEQFKHL